MPNSSAEDEWFDSHADWDVLDDEEGLEDDFNPFPHLPWFPGVVRKAKVILAAQKEAEEIAQRKLEEISTGHLRDSGIVLNSVIIRNDEKI